MSNLPVIVYLYIGKLTKHKHYTKDFLIIWDKVYLKN